MQKFFSVSLVIVALSWCISFAQESSVPQVFQSIYNDTSIPLRDMVDVPISQTSWEDGIIPWREIPFDNQQYERDPALQKSNGANSSGTIVENFEGVSAQGYAPPDVTCTVGPNHVMQMVNVRYQIWDKTGTSLVGPFNLGTIWAGFPGPWSSSLNDGDPVVLYDQVADRWFASQFSLPNGGSGPEYILIAISQTGDPTGAWHRYGFMFPQFPDYPHYGIWPDGYYMSVNRFAPSFTGTYAAAFERAEMLAGNPAQYVYFTNSTAVGGSFLPSDWDGITPPPTGAPNYFTALNSSTSLRTYEFHVDWVTPANSTFTGPLSTTVSPYSQISNIQQLGTGQTLDGLSDRLMQRQQYRNFGTHQSMVTCHSIDAGGSRAGMRWYELRNTGSGWTLYQEGTYAPADGQERWMGSIAMNGDGDIALGYSVSSTTIHPEIRYTGRQDGDPLGTMTITEGTIFAGGGSQTGGLSRWGDYSHMSVDPTDDHTFWYSNEYIPSNGSFNWNTRIASFYFGSPCPIDPASNPNPTDGAVDVPLSGNTATWTNGAGANQIELWFGESGSLVQVYDGSPITSFSLAPVEPLNYGTEYGWKVIGKNDTCDVAGPTWTFITIPDPNLITDTIDVYPQNFNYWTGTCNTSTKTQVSLVDADGADFAGWMAFDVSSIPNNATILSITFNGYLYANNYPYWAITPMGSVNPVTGSASAIFNQVSNNYAEGTAYSYNEESGDLTNGWQQRPLETTAPADMESTLSQGWFAIGIYDWDSGLTYFVNYEGWAETNVPYLKVIYESVVPVELTSFTAASNGADVELTWSTATETNNQGFQVEKMNAAGTFEQIGYLAGFGTTTEPKAYSFIDSKLDGGTYSYRLKQIDFDGSYEYSDAVEVEVSIPAVYSLDQNYPNPFNPSTTIKYSIAEDGFVKLAVYNMLGEEVATIVNTTQKAGKYEVNFNANQLSSGVYVYRIEAANFTASKKLMLLK